MKRTGSFHEIAFFLISVCLHSCGILILARTERSLSFSRASGPAGVGSISVVTDSMEPARVRSPQRPRSIKGLPQEPASMAGQEPGPTKVVDDPSGKSGGASSGPSGEPANAYLALIHQRIAQQVRYPLPLQRRGVVGQVMILLRIAANGSIVDAGISQASGHVELDRLALDSVKASGPFPVPDFPVGIEPLRLLIPIDFKIP